MQRYKVFFSLANYLGKNEKRELPSEAPFLDKMLVKTLFLLSKCQNKNVQQGERNRVPQTVITQLGYAEAMPQRAEAWVPDAEAMPLQGKSYAFVW